MSSENPNWAVISSVQDCRRPDPESNEDALFITATDDTIVAAVFDGATAIAKIPYFEDLGISPGKMAAQLARTTLGGLPIALSPRNAVPKIDQAFAHHAEQLPIDTNLMKVLFSCMALIVKISRHEKMLDYAYVGDCNLVINRKRDLSWLSQNNVLPFERREVQAALQVHRETGLSMAQTLDNPTVQAIIATHRLLENSPLGTGYGALKGDSTGDISLYMQTGSVEIQACDTLYLFTDGSLLSVLDNESMLHHVRTGLLSAGIIGLVSRTRQLEEADPNLTTYPRLKKHHDIAAIEVKLTNL